LLRYGAVGFVVKMIGVYYCGGLEIATIIKNVACYYLWSCIAAFDF
jgi:hypothetical protein